MSATGDIEELRLTPEAARSRGFNLDPTAPTRSTVEDVSLAEIHAQLYELTRVAWRTLAVLVILLLFAVAGSVVAVMSVMSGDASDSIRESGSRISEAGR